MAGDSRRLFIGQEAATWSQPRGAGPGQGNGSQLWSASLRSAHAWAAPSRHPGVAGPGRTSFPRRAPVSTLMRGAGNLTLIDINEPAIQLVSSTPFRFTSQSLPTKTPSEASLCVPHAGPNFPLGAAAAPLHAESHQAGVPAQPGATGTARRTPRLQRAGREDTAEADGGRVR